MTATARQRLLAGISGGIASLYAAHRGADVLQCLVAGIFAGLLYTAIDSSIPRKKKEKK